METDTSNVHDMTKKLIKNAIDTISNTDAELAELKVKYDRAIKFIKYIKKFSCELIDPCRACDALDILRELGEE